MSLNLSSFLDCCLYTSVWFSGRDSNGSRPTGLDLYTRIHILRDSDG